MQVNILVNNYKIFVNLIKHASRHIGYFLEIVMSTFPYKPEAMLGVS